MVSARTLLILVELAGYLGVVCGLYLMVATSPSSAGGEDSTPVEDPRPPAAGGLTAEELVEAWRAQRIADELDRLDSSSVLDRLDRLDDEAGACPRCGSHGCDYCRAGGL
jgi:hypothetical protein